MSGEFLKGNSDTSGSSFSGDYNDLTNQPHIPTQDDVDSKLSQAAFETLNALPGLPVTDVSLAFLANIALVSIDDQLRVSRMTDPLTGSVLEQADNRIKPVLELDGDNKERLYFSDAAYIRKDDVNAGAIGGPNGNTTSFMMVFIPRVKSSQTQFMWGIPGSTKVISVNFMRSSNGQISLDHGSYPDGRWAKSSTALTAGAINSVFYERNGGTAELWINGVSEGSQSVSDGLPTDGTELPFTFGADGAGGFTSEFDLYALFFYGRVLSEEEKQKMFLFSKKLFGV